MEQQQNLSNEQPRRNVAEKMWLNYFKNTLLEKGMIRPEDHRRMKVYISTRKPPAMKRKNRGCIRSFNARMILLKSVLQPSVRFAPSGTHRSGDCGILNSQEEFYC